MRQLAISLLIAASCSCAQDYALGPDSQPHDGVPKGTVTKYQLPPGKFYPGTPHNYSVYVPAQYNAAKPAPFMIYMDGSGALGNGQRVPVVFDNLIARGELPPLIGIFIDPGVLPALSDQAQNRFERIFEYDSVSGRFADFLIGEVIPEVAKKYNLSSDPNDRGLSGQSTGAVAALCGGVEPAGSVSPRAELHWNLCRHEGRGRAARPDSQDRAEAAAHFSAGRQERSIVPAEPFGTFYAGSWPINNQVMFEALGVFGIRREIDHRGRRARWAASGVHYAGGAALAVARFSEADRSA